MLAPHGLTIRYWTAMGQNIYSLLREDVDEFWLYYRNIIRMSAQYTLRQLLGVALALMPMFLVMVVFGAWLESIWNKGAIMTIIPENAVELIVPMNGDSTSPRARGEGSHHLSESPLGVTLVLNGGHTHELENPRAKYVLRATDSVTDFLYSALGFTVISVGQSSNLNGHPAVIVRARNNDRNPFWPYLSDLEFVFFLSFSLSSIVLMLHKKKYANPAGEASYDMSWIDYILTGIATRYTGAMCAIGNWESRIMSGRLSKIEIVKPIFITGLARAGTTVLLETLNRMNSVASHRYRDFPFIMTPIFWNRVVSLLSTKQAPIERPHRDGIQITRESPDAFEEPMWKHFFPFLHDPEALHQLNENNGNGEFEGFYRDHIRKIMSIRKGSRYLSKGNYNVTRIEYICRIFPDAKFIIPIRHPLHHVESLVRQNKIFSAYSKENRHVAEYLEAVGHYEFGPQRKPICVTRDGGKRTLSAWAEGDDCLGYAIQWAEVYKFVADLHEKRRDLIENMMVVRYEDLCSDPEGAIGRILRFADLERETSSGGKSHNIKPPSRALELDEKQITSVWAAVEAVARLYGYTRNVAELDTLSITTLAG
jgi:hypothetical protein